MSQTDHITELTALVTQCPPGSRIRKPLGKLLARLTVLDQQWKVSNLERATDKTGDPAHGRDLKRELASGSISPHEAEALRKASLKHRERARARLEKQIRRGEVLVKKMEVAIREFVEATMPELRNAGPKERLEAIAQILDRARGCDSQTVEETKMGIGLLMIREFRPTDESTQIN